MCISPPFRRVLLGVAAISVLLLSAGIGMLVLTPSPRTPMQATVLPTPVPLPEFALVDHRGDAFTLDSFRGRWHVVFFGFTQCPDICPVTLRQLVTARQHMAQTMPNDDLPDIVFVSVDPVRDTQETVAAYVQAFGESVVGVTGALDEINTLSGAVGIFHARRESDDGAYTVEHSAAAVVIDEYGRFHAVFSPPHNAETLARDLAVIMAGD